MIYAQIAERDTKGKEPYRMLIISTAKKCHERNPRAISHVLGSEDITIQGREGESAITVHGRKNIKELRDALIHLCNFMEIP